MTVENFKVDEDVEQEVYRELSILNIVEKMPWLSSRRLARDLEYDSATIGKALGQLHRKGLVKYTGNRRRYIVTAALENNDE